MRRECLGGVGQEDFGSDELNEPTEASLPEAPAESNDFGGFEEGNE